jgi:hypothetical protein
MLIQQLSHNRRHQVALGTVSLALAGIAALTVIGGSRHTAALASRSGRSNRVAAGQSVTAGVVTAGVVAEQASAATLAAASRWTTGTTRWLAQHRWGFAFVGSAAQAAYVSTASAEQAAAGSTTSAPAQCSMSAHSSTRGGSVASVCLNPQVTLPNLSGTVQRLRSARHVSVTLPSYSPGRSPSATAPSAHVGTLPSAQTGHNEVTVNLGTNPSVTRGSVDAGTVGHVNAPDITVH